MQGYKVKEKQQLYPIVPPVSKLSGHPVYLGTNGIDLCLCFYWILELYRQCYIFFYFPSYHYAL